MIVIRAGLICLIAFSVLAFGAVEVWSSSVVEIGAAFLLVVWAWITFRQREPRVDWNPLNWPLLGLFGVGLLQLFFRTTSYGYFTRVELLRLAAYIIIFFLATQSFKTRADLTGLAWFLICFAFAVSLFGIIQALTSRGQIYWYRELTLGGTFFGPYVNRNHFAGFIELTVPIGLALIVFRGLRRDLLPLATLLAITPVAALVLSASRGGIISFAFGMAVLALLAWTRPSHEHRRVATLGVVALAALALVVWVGAGGAIERFSNRSGGTPFGRRLSMARGAEQIFRDHPIIGSGLGTLVVVYPKYETVYDGLVVEHVHNDYMELLSETGLLGALCGVSFLVLLWREARKNFWAEQGYFSRGLRAGAIAALSCLLVHSLVDFNLHIPANAVLFLLQAHLATCDPLPFGARERPVPRRVRGSRIPEVAA
jgi:O-antigen ligase